ncbi:MAG: hypothetical protein EAZ77_10320 [Nostocales cyanobacterium]|nr:MAG: hypothetical protein EAZ77_10320 [Nostocales cyanobacterium]
MIAIKDIVQKALATGYLSAKAENQIHQLLQTNYDSEDLDALIILQRSVTAGEVKQESRRHKNYHPLKEEDNSSNIKLAYQIAAEIACVAAMALTMQHHTHDQPSVGT